jgi:hypothetical protein
MSNCNCPLPSLVDIQTAESCPFDIQQIQRVYVTKKTNTTFPMTIASSDPALAATWAALVATAVTDVTKVVMTPLIGGEPTIEGGNPLTLGGGSNETLNGAPENTGREASLFSCVFRSRPIDVMRKLKDLECHDLMVFFIDDAERIHGVSADGGTTFTGIPVDGKSWFVSDRTNQGFNSKDTNGCQFSLKGRWDDYLYTVSTASTFNPLSLYPA